MASEYQNFRIRVKEVATELWRAIRKPDEYVILTDNLNHEKHLRHSWFNQATEFEEELGRAIRIIDRLLDKDRHAKKDARAIVKRNIIMVDKGRAPGE